MHSYSIVDTVTKAQLQRQLPVISNSPFPPPSLNHRLIYVRFKSVPIYIKNLVTLALNQSEIKLRRELKMYCMYITIYIL